MHSASFSASLENIAAKLRIDSQSLSVAFRTLSVFHEDWRTVLMANVPERSKNIGEFTLLVANMGKRLLYQMYISSLFSGTGKSAIFSSIMKVYYLKRNYDQIHASSDSHVKNTNFSQNGQYRHAILSEACSIDVVFSKD
jgi:hypothetical protein